MVQYAGDCGKHGVSTDTQRYAKYLNPKWFFKIGNIQRI